MNVMLLSVSVWSGAEGSTRRTVPLDFRADRGAGDRLCRAAVLQSAWRALQRGRTNMDVPISLGVLIATALSLYETVGRRRACLVRRRADAADLPARGPRARRDDARPCAQPGSTHCWARRRKGAQVVGPDGTLAWVAAEELEPGMVMRVAAGERLAADGEIIVGRSTLRPVAADRRKRPVALADRASRCSPARSILHAPVDVRVSRAGRDTTLAEIARLMEASTQDRSRYVRIADRAARLYAPAVHSLALLTVVGWLLAGAGCVPGAGDRRCGADHHLPLRARPGRAGGAGGGQRGADAAPGSW